MMVDAKLATTVMACFIVLSLVAPLAFVGGAQAQTTSNSPEVSCDTEVAHDGFLDDEGTIQSFNDSGSASDVGQNTRVTIEETSSFYRVRAENPNTYCVHATVSVSSEILPPTNLGTVASNGDVTSAKWEDVLDFDRQRAHTEISFIMPPNSTILFAPSKPTVLLPAWRDSQKHEAQGVLDRVSSMFDDTELEQRTYHFSANGSPSVTVPLINEEDEDQQITEWKAVYRTDDTEPWAPVDKDTEDPVFYQDIENGDKVRFYFNDADAKVEFVANPTMRDSALWELRSFRRSVHDLSDYWPFGTVVFAEVPAW